MPKISSITVVTPVLNAEHLIAETALSILQQRAVLSGRVRLQYLVCDGGSSDGTVQAVRRLAHPAITVFSEPDRGMYDALVKGLRRAEGEVVTYLNAGDFLLPTAFDLVAEVMETKPEVNWLCGWGAICNEASQVTNLKLAYTYRRHLIQRGAYGAILPWVQQEGIFWRGGLHALVDLETLSGLRLAGDFYLWQSFAREHELHVVQSLMGVFKKHEGQLSSALAKYRAEMALFKQSLTPLDLVTALWDNLMWWLPAPVKKRLNPGIHIAYDHKLQRWV